LLVCHEPFDKEQESFIIEWANNQKLSGARPSLSWKILINKMYEKFRKKFPENKVKNFWYSYSKRKPKNEVGNVISLLENDKNENVASTSETVAPPFGNYGNEDKDDDIASEYSSMEDCTSEYEDNMEDCTSEYSSMEDCTPSSHSEYEDNMEDCISSSHSSEYELNNNTPSSLTVFEWLLIIGNHEYEQLNGSKY
jgi:hypothetical protein